MAKYNERIEARKLRKNGKSINKIAKYLNVSKGSVSRWCVDITLSSKQKLALTSQISKHISKGALIACENRKKERLSRVSYFRKVGENMVGKINLRELFLVGAGLYWAEGGKTQRKVVFINSDPEMIKIFIKWVHLCLRIPKDRLLARIEINDKFTKRIENITKFWSVLTQIPITQFRKPSFKHSRLKKIYYNDCDYKGSLQITVAKGTNLNYEILGYVSGLAKAGNMIK